MTDDEIIAALKEADALLTKYREMVAPIAAELAKQKSLFVFSKEGGYRGELGCYESGPNVICLHIEDAFRGKTYTEYLEKAETRAYDFDFEWGNKVGHAGIQGIFISGHY